MLLGISHTIGWLSLTTARLLPSGEKTPPRGTAFVVVKDLLGGPDCRIQTLTVLSDEAETRVLPSGE
jgi:hypothetical protein